MSRWRHTVLAFLPNLSVCPKPTAEKKHDPGPTDNEIKNVDIIPHAGPLPACALKGRGKAAASFNNVHASSGTKALPSRNAHSRECDMSLLSRALGRHDPVELLLAPAEILLPHQQFIAQRMARNGRAVAGGWLV